MDGNTDVLTSQDDRNGSTVHGGKQGVIVDQVRSMDAPIAEFSEYNEGLLSIERIRNQG